MNKLNFDINKILYYLLIFLRIFTLIPFKIFEYLDKKIQNQIHLIKHEIEIGDITNEK